MLIDLLQTLFCVILNVAKKKGGQSEEYVQLYSTTNLKVPPQL